MNIEKIDELLALQKVLMFVKFGSEEYDAHYLAVSPIVGELLRKVNKELNKHFVERKITHNTEFGSIEDYPNYIEKVKIHLQNIDNWTALDQKIQKEVIIDMCAPFTVPSSIIETLIRRNRT
ncbi:hypothetical protein [Spirosoma litoris]